MRASDLKGDRPLPPTSNVNWSADGQTVANLVITAVGGENTLEVHAGGSGRTHFIVDVQAYVPALTAALQEERSGQPDLARPQPSEPAPVPASKGSTGDVE